MNSLMALLMGDKSALVTKEKALPGRASKMEVPEKHFVTGNTMEQPFPSNLEHCVFGSGCFWGSEKAAWRMPGVWSSSVGYAGGFTPNPTYEEVCSGQTGHTEVYQVVWDPEIVGFADILRIFWQSHDPTQGMRQGNDSGTQYRSALFPATPEQHKLVLASKEAYQGALSKAGFGAITTEIGEPGATEYYFAEGYHQQYLAKPGSRPYCSAQPTGVAMPEYAGGECKLPEKYFEKYGPRPGCTIGFPNEQVKMDELK